MLGLASGCWALPAPGGFDSAGPEPLLQLVQAPSAESARVAIAGERLIVRAAPSGNSRIVDHVEKGDEVIVVDTQSQWAKIEDYQSGRALGWVYESLLVAPGG
jgi:uncharacterized protein YgiM (DUF1202 family)